jgi:hypothetical protein
MTITIAKNNSVKATDNCHNKLNPLNSTTMNRQEFKAISRIARKMHWHNKPVIEVCEIINQMVRNQQALELDCTGECDDYEETLLSIATWNNDYHSLIGYEHSLFLETMGITEEDYKAMQEYYDTVALQHGIEDAEYERECEEYEQALYEEYSWYIHARQMGWE